MTATKERTSPDVRFARSMELFFWKAIAKADLWRRNDLIVFELTVVNVVSSNAGTCKSLVRKLFVKTDFGSPVVLASVS